MASVSDEIEVVERERRVIELRRAGYTFDDIAKAVGYSFASGAHAAYRRALKRTLQEAGVEELREAEVDRLDRLQRALWTQALTGDVKAISTLLRLMERRARLLGLDAPQKIQAEVTTYEGGGEIEREVQRLAELLANAQSSGGTNSLGEQGRESQSITAD